MTPEADAADYIFGDGALVFREDIGREVTKELGCVCSSTIYIDFELVPSENF